MNKKDFIINICMFIISLFINIIMLYFAIDASQSSRHSEEIAQESLNAIKDSNNRTKDSYNLTLQSIKWIEEPRPLISYSTNLDYLGNNRIANLQVVPYNGINTKFGDIEWIRLTIYNSGRAPLMAPKLYANLTANDINSAVFPFKIHKVQTPLEKIYYNDTAKKIFESIESPFNSEETIEFELRTQDYPPYLNNNRIVYPYLGHKSYSSSFSVERENPNLIIDLNTETQTPSLGPLEIGTIEPGKKVEIDIWLFAAIESLDRNDLMNQINNYSEKNIQENRPEWDSCRNVTKGSDERFKCMNQYIFFEYTTGNLRLIIESEKNETAIHPIDIPLRASFRI